MPACLFEDFFPYPVSPLFLCQPPCLWFVNLYLIPRALAPYRQVLVCLGARLPCGPYFHVLRAERLIPTPRMRLIFSLFLFFPQVPSPFAVLAFSPRAPSPPPLSKKLSLVGRDLFIYLLPPGSTCLSPFLYSPFSLPRLFRVILGVLGHFLR